MTFTLKMYIQLPSDAFGYIKFPKCIDVGIMGLKHCFFALDLNRFVTKLVCICLFLHKKE